MYEMETEGNLIDQTNNLIYIKLRKDIAFSIMKNIENICLNFDSFRNGALLKFILTDSHLYIFIKVEKLDNIFIFEIEFNDRISIHNTDFQDSTIPNKQFLFKLNTFRKFLKTLIWKKNNSNDYLYLFFDNDCSQLFMRDENFQENEEVYIENMVCSFLEMEDDDFEIDIKPIWSAELSASNLISNLQFAKENFSKDNGNEGCNFNFLLEYYEEYKYKNILQVRFYKTNEKKEMSLHIPFFESQRKSNKNKLNNNNNSEIENEDSQEDQYSKNLDIIEDFKEKNLHRIFFDTKHLINLLKCFDCEDKFTLKFLESKGLVLNITTKAGFDICYIFPKKGVQN